MRIHFKLTRELYQFAQDDLLRPHGFAAERVGFITCRFGRSPTGVIVAIAQGYSAVADGDYLDDRRYGALIGSNAIRKALQLSLSENVGLFHVHLHEHPGTPVPSGIDLRETAKFVPDFFNIRPMLPHGALILSLDSLSGRAWSPRDRLPRAIKRFTVVGFPLFQPMEGR